MTVRPGGTWCTVDMGEAAWWVEGTGCDIRWAYEGWLGRASLSGRGRVGGSGVARRCLTEVGGEEKDPSQESETLT